MERTPRQIVFIAGAVGVIAGFSLGFFAGREQLRSESRNSIANAFTGVNGSQENPKTKPKASESATSLSSIRQTKNEITDEMKYTFSVTSDNELINSIGMRERGSIFARCEGGVAELYLVGAGFLSSDGERVKLRWDDGEPQSEWWRGSSSGDALLSGAPISFLLKASAAKKLVIQYTPWRKTSETAIYKFSKNNQSDFAKMLSHCG